MATVLVTNEAGVLIREYEVPPVERIQCEPGERVIFIDTRIDDVRIETLGDIDVLVTVGDSAVVIERFYANLEAAEDVQLVFADAFETRDDPLDIEPGANVLASPQAGIIASLDALIETAAGNPDTDVPVTDDGLGNDGRVTVGDLEPGHVRAEGVDGEVPAVVLASPPPQPTPVPELAVAAATPPADVTPDPSEDFEQDETGFTVVPEDGDEAYRNGVELLAVSASALSYDDLFEPGLVDVAPALGEDRNAVPQVPSLGGDGLGNGDETEAESALALAQTDEV